VIDLRNISSNLEQNADGLWHARYSSAISYPEWGNEACFQLENSSFWFQHRNDCILEAMKQFPPRGAIFDIGGGNGFVAKSMQDAGLEVVLIEPGLTGAKNAQSRGIRSIVCSTLEDAQFLPSSMPAVGLFDVVEHVDNDREFMRLVRDHLTSGGRAYLTVPAYNFLWSQEDIEAGHQRRYSQNAIRDLMLNSGFSVDFLTGFFQYLTPAIFVLRALPYRLGLAQSLRSHQITVQMERQHILKDGLLLNVFKRLQKLELDRIRAHKETNHGASWLVIATVR
jgi:SAM-dependent methyltransferase